MISTIHYLGVLLAIFHGISCLGNLQSAAATGRLFCNLRPYPNARIKFWEYDFGLFQDDLLMETRSDENGAFQVYGNDTEIGSIRPRVYILHNCNDEATECWRKVVIEVPKAYVSEGGVPRRVFNIGELSLDAHLPGEARDCITP
ncbi:unnamed protein product, partial [Mesorhabditis spiculigera]